MPMSIDRLCGIVALIVSASCSFPRPADIGDDDGRSDAGDGDDADSMGDGGGIPGNTTCQLTAIEPSIANADDIMMLEGTFAETVTVNFPGGTSAVATVLGPHRARVTVPAAATEGTLMITSCSSTVGALTFRRASFVLGVGPFSTHLEQAEGPQQPAALTAPRAGHTSVVIADRLYVIGGAGGSGSLINVEQATINANGSIGSLSRAPSVSLVTARRAHTSTVIGKALYVVGGLGNGPLSSIERADINSDGSLGAFSIVSNVALTIARSGHASVIVGNYLYILGGSGNTALDSVERATINSDGSLGAFAVVPTVTLTMARSGHTASVTGNYVYVIGGTRGNSTLQDVERATINPDGSLGPFAPVVSAALTTARSGHTAELLGNHLYVVAGGGGNGALNSVERAQLSDTGSLGSFAIVPDATLTTARRDHSTNVIGNHLYILGGSGSTLLKSIERSGLNTTGDMSPFATVTRIAVATARSGFSSALLGRSFYIVGGFDGPTSSRNDVERAILAQDGSLEAFATIPGSTLVAPRGGHVSAVIGNYLYILPGFGVPGFEKVVINDDGSLGTFTIVVGAALATTRFGFTAVVIDNHLYIIGGDDSNLVPLNSIERAPVRSDFSLGTFEQVPGVTLNVARLNHTSVQLGRFLYVIGGSNASLLNDTPPLNSVERATINPDGSLGPFSPVANVSLTTGRLAHSTVVVGRNLYVLGGRGAGGYLNSIERAAIASDGTLGAFSIVQGVTLATEREGAATAVVGNYLYVVGGDNGPRLTSIERATLNADGSLRMFVTVPRQSRRHASR